MLNSLTRIAIITAAAAFALASASGQKGSESPASNDNKLVSMTITLDTDGDAIPMFERGARKAICKATTGEKDGLRMIVVACDDDGIVVLQKGRELALACPSQRFSKQQCKDFALALLDGRRYR